MHTTLSDAMNDRPWSVSAAVRDLELIIDDEGRPLGERRAPSVAKIGVPMVLKACPYPDERAGIAINVSALAQLTAHLDEILGEIAGFHERAARDPGWIDIFTIVIDQLAGPAIHLLRQRNEHARLPAVRAVGHKLAEGYYGVVRSIVALEAAGLPRPVDTESLLEFVRQQNALVGASEACAGPPPMLQRVSAVLLCGHHGRPAALPQWRFEIANALATQLAIGIAWEQFDRETLRALLVDDIGRIHMRARNHFMAGILDEHLAHVHSHPRSQSDGFQYARLIPQGEVALREHLCSPAPAGCLEVAAETITMLYAHGNGAVLLLNPADLAVLARAMAHYFSTYRHLLSALVRQELVLRELLGFSTSAPVRFGSMVLARCRAIELLEAIVGHRLEHQPETNAIMTLRNHHRCVTLPL